MSHDITTVSLGCSRPCSPQPASIFPPTSSQLQRAVPATAAVPSSTDFGRPATVTKDSRLPDMLWIGIVNEESLHKNRVKASYFANMLKQAASSVAKVTQKCTRRSFSSLLAKRIWRPYTVHMNPKTHKPAHPQLWIKNYELASASTQGVVGSLCEYGCPQ